VGYLPARDDVEAPSQACDDSSSLACNNRKTVSIGCTTNTNITQRRLTAPCAPCLRLQAVHRPALSVGPTAWLPPQYGGTIQSPKTCFKQKAGLYMTPRTVIITLIYYRHKPEPKAVAGYTSASFAFRGPTAVNVQVT
jgi:hypothetical protein